LDGLLLSAAQVSTAMGATGMTVSHTDPSLHDESAIMADKDCRITVDDAEPTGYADSGYSAVRFQGLREPGDNATHFANQTVVLFPSASQAAAFFTASGQRWPACSNRQFTRTRAGQPPDVWTAGAISNTNGTLSNTATETDPSGFACQRALTVSNNVAIDVSACSANPADSAVNIAHQISAKVQQ
jgi:hypothetical protein